MRNPKGKARSANDPRQLELFTLTPEEIKTVEAFASAYEISKGLALRQALMLGFHGMRQCYGPVRRKRTRLAANVVTVNFSKSRRGKEDC